VKVAWGRSVLFMNRTLSRSLRLSIGGVDWGAIIAKYL